MLNLSGRVQTHGMGTIPAASAFVDIRLHATVSGVPIRKPAQGTPDVSRSRSSGLLSNG